MKTKLIALSLLIALFAVAQFGPTRTTHFPITASVQPTDFFIANRPGDTNYNVASTNMPAFLNALVVSQFYQTPTNRVAWTSNNLYSGIVTLALGTNIFFITNSAFGTNSLVMTTILDDDANVTSAKALNIATNVVKLKANTNAAANCRIGWKLISK